MENQSPDANHSTASGDVQNRRWLPIYAGVMLFATLIIVVLFLFSRHYSG